MQITQYALGGLAILDAVIALPLSTFPEATDVDRAAQQDVARVTPKQAEQLEVHFPTMHDCPKPTVILDTDGKSHTLCPRVSHVEQEDIVKHVLCSEDEGRHPKCPVPHPLAREMQRCSEGEKECPYSTAFAEDGVPATTDPYLHADGSYDKNSSDDIALSQANGSVRALAEEDPGTLASYLERISSSRGDAASSRIQILKNDGTPMDKAEIKEWMAANHIFSNPDIERQAREDLKHQLEIAKALQAQTSAVHDSHKGHVSTGKTWLENLGKYVIDFEAEQDKTTVEPENRMAQDTRQSAPVSGPATTPVATQPDVTGSDGVDDEGSVSLDRRSITPIEESLKSLNTKLAEEYYRRRRLQQPEDHIGYIGRVKGLREGRLRGLAGKKPHAGSKTKHDDQSADMTRRCSSLPIWSGAPCPQVLWCRL
jgi:hypothetical protein